MSDYQKPLDDPWTVPSDVEILIGPNWHRGRLTSLGQWSHFSGSSHWLFGVTFEDGATIYCGINSIRRIV